MVLSSRRMWSSPMSEALIEASTFTAKKRPQSSTVTSESIVDMEDMVAEEWRELVGLTVNRLEKRGGLRCARLVLYGFLERANRR